VEAPVECGQTVMQGQAGAWTLENNSCPVSTAQAKRDIQYVVPSDADRLYRQLLDVRLATYRYRQGDAAKHLGFIIEDMPPGSPAILPSRDRVDLYGYVSMTVAALKVQAAQLAALKAEVRRLRRAQAKGAAPPAERR
jgi:hypothetical protein